MATQRTQIYLEGVSVDLDKNIDTDLTYSIADIEDFETRKTTYSKTVSIPATANNNFLFGNYFDANIENPYDSLVENVGVNFNPLKKAFVQVLVDNVEVFAGVLRLLEIKQLEDGSIVYECALFGSLGGLFSAIGDKLLTDLNWSAYNALFNVPSIQASWSNTDWIFTLANYGLITRTNPDWNFDINSFRPSFFLKTIYNKILSEAGYTSNDFWTNNLEKLLLINGDEKFDIYLDRLFLSVFNATSFSTGTHTMSWQGDGDYFFELSGNNIRNNSGSTGIFAKVSGTIIYNLVGASTKNITIACAGGSVIKTLVAGNNTVDFQFNGTFLSATNYPFTITTTGAGTITIADNSPMYIDLIDKTKKYPAAIGGRIVGKNFVPDGMKQSDFLKAIFNLFNLYVTQNDENEFDLIVKAYPDFYTTNEVNWTYKVDNNKGFSVKPSNQYLPKSFIYKYKEDSDYYSKNYKQKYDIGFGGYIKATENEFSKDDKTAEIPFALPITLKAGHTLDMYLPAIYDLQENGDYKQIKTSPKLAFFGGVKSCTNYHIVEPDGTHIDNTNTTYPYCGHLYDFATNGNATSNLWDLCFNTPKELYYTPTISYPQNNLYKFYYEDYVYNVNSKDSKLVSLYLLLNNLDIKNIDFTKLVRIGTTLYYLNLVDGYNPLANELTKVELLKYNPLIIEEF
jgi:hypothetical protein